jgi:hypothetical protein
MIEVHLKATLQPADPPQTPAIPSSAPPIGVEPVESAQPLKAIREQRTFTRTNTQPIHRFKRTAPRAAHVEKPLRREHQICGSHRSAVITFRVVMLARYRASSS